MATAVSAIHHQMESEDQAQIMEMVPTLHSVCQAKTSNVQIAAAVIIVMESSRTFEASKNALRNV